MTADAQFLITYLTEVETLAEDLLADKHQMVDLDRKRNSNREALRAVQGGAAADQEQLESEMTRIRRELKVKMNRLNEAQGLHTPCGACGLSDHTSRWKTGAKGLRSRPAVAGGNARDQ
ncbi:p53 and DNA damage-regulated protein 1 isoform X3 [Lampetra planeri]